MSTRPIFSCGCGESNIHFFLHDLRQFWNNMGDEWGWWGNWKFGKGNDQTQHLVLSVVIQTDYDWFELETFLFYFIFSCISYRDLDIRGDTVKIQTDVIACCCMSTVQSLNPCIVSNSTAKTWFVGFPSLVSLRSPKYWPESAPGRFGVGDSVKVKPKLPPFARAGRD